MTNKKWPTKNQDMQIANLIMEEYAQDNNTLGLFELYVDQRTKRMNFRLASWVRALSVQFASMYGKNQGDFVTRKVLTNCIRHEQTLH